MAILLNSTTFTALASQSSSPASAETTSIAMADSISMKKSQGFVRGLSNYQYIPKNEWMFGFTASYTGFDSNDSDLLMLIKDFNFAGSLIGVNPYVGYFVADNQCLGLKLGYSATTGQLGNFSLDIIEDMNISLTDLEYNASFYSAGIFHRAYLGLTRGGQLGIFNETSLTYHYGVSHFVRGNEESGITDTKTVSNEIALGLAPGLSVFIMDNVSASVSVGILGLSYKHNKQYIGEEFVGEFMSSGANFQINILNINLGVTVHI
jgi:hypothetical protein